VLGLDCFPLIPLIRVPHAAVELPLAGSLLLTIRAAIVVGTPVYRTQDVLVRVLPDSAINRVVRSNGKQLLTILHTSLSKASGLSFPLFRIDSLDFWMRRNRGKVNLLSGLACLPQISLIRVPCAAGEFPIPSSLPRRDPRGYSGQDSRLPTTGHSGSRTP
jgi:hypothetical protein